jgi:hypothetical protein
MHVWLWSGRPEAMKALEIKPVILPGFKIKITKKGC